MRRMRGWVTVLATLSGCGSHAQPPQDPKPIVVDNPPPQFVVEPAPAGRLLLSPAPAIDIQQLLASDVVQSHRFSRSTLYTWTTTEQIDELRAGKPLLSRDESPKNGGSFIDQVLHQLATVRDPMAKLLSTTAFAKMRFAWPTMWATRAGWPREAYGEQLIRITLKPEAWTVRLTTTSRTFEVHDDKDGVVPISTALASPQRIAAIYFISDRSQPEAPGMPRPIASFREYVLCNESMIASWEVGTERIAREVAEATTKVENILRWTEATTPAVPATTAPASTWEAGAAPADPIATYHQALALDSSTYWLRPSILRELVDQLRNTPKPPAIERVPTVKFSAARTARKAPRIVEDVRDPSFARPASMTAAHK